MVTDAETQPWKKQPRETGKAYEAFKYFLNLGPTRSRNRVAVELQKSHQLVYRWAARDHWLDRAEEWDAELSRKEFDEQLQVARDMGRRHAQIAARGIEKAVRRLVDMDPNELTPSQTLRYVVELCRIERISRGEPEHLEALRANGADAGFDIRSDIEEYAPVYQSMLDRGLIRIEGKTGYGEEAMEEDPDY